MFVESKQALKKVLYIVVIQLDTMKKQLLLLLIMSVLGTGCVNAQKLSKNSAFDILMKWEGKWKNNTVFEQSVWISESIETRGTTEANLILSNNYLEIMVYNDNESKYIICYDQMSSQFNRWEFKSDGNNTFWTGKWNKSENTMTWSFIDFSNSGISGKIIENFKSDEMIKTRIIMKDKSGKSLLKINSTKEKT